MIKIKNILQESYGKRGIEIQSSYEKYIGYDVNDKFLNDTTIIYRGADIYNGNAVLIQPSKHTRQSAYTQNYYTLIIDNSKYWKDYPKRSKSIICTTNYYHAQIYSADFLNGIYRVYPKYNAKIAICPSDDIWSSFGNGFTLLNNFFNNSNPNMDINIDALSDFNDFLEIKFKIKEQDNYKTIAQKINKYMQNSEMKILLKKHKYNTLFEFIDYCLSPELNGFQLTRFNENFKAGENKEVWTDADSILIKAKPIE